MLIGFFWMWQASCHLIEVNWHFRGYCCLHHQVVVYSMTGMVMTMTSHCDVDDDDHNNHHHQGSRFLRNAYQQIPEWMMSHLRDSDTQLPNSWLLPECENRVLIILRPKKKRVIGGCRQMQREEFHGWYFSSIFLGWINQGWDGRDMQKTWRRSECIQNFGQKTWMEDIA